MFVINFSLVSIKSFASTNPFQKNSVLKRGRGGIPPPNPLLPPRPSEAVRNSAQNVFALGSEYPIASFSLRSSYAVHAQKINPHPRRRMGVAGEILYHSSSASNDR